MHTLILILFELACYLFFSSVMFRLFNKAEVQNAWFAFVPILNTVTFLHTIDRSGWNLLWMFVPFANIVFAIIWYVDFFKAFGRNPWWTLVLMIPYVDIVALLYIVYMSFSSNVQYQLHRTRYDV